MRAVLDVVYAPAVRSERQVIESSHSIFQNIRNRFGLQLPKRGVTKKLSRAAMGPSASAPDAIGISILLTGSAVWSYRATDCAYASGSL
jgi:hypothetical protein